MEVDSLSAEEKTGKSLRLRKADSDHEILVKLKIYLKLDTC